MKCKVIGYTEQNPPKHIFKLYDRFLLDYFNENKNGSGDSGGEEDKREKRWTIRSINTIYLRKFESWIGKALPQENKQK